MCPLLDGGIGDLFPRSNKMKEITPDIAKQFNRNVVEGNYRLVKSALQNGIHYPDRCTNKASYFTYSPLMLATSNEKLAIMELLLSYDAQVNYVNNQGMTALHIAASKENPIFVQLLILSGADVNLKYNGKTAKDIAADNNNLKVMEAIDSASLKYNEDKKICDAIICKI